MERWRKGLVPRGSGLSLVKFLDRVAEISGLGLAGLGAEARVPPRRLAELSRYGMTASASLIRRHSDARRLATLVATVRHLQAKSVDDALELLDLLMTTEMLGRAQQESDRENARQHPRLAWASARLAVGVAALFDSVGWGGPGEEPGVSQVWEAIEAIVSRVELRSPSPRSRPAPAGREPRKWWLAHPSRAITGTPKGQTARRQPQHPLQPHSRPTRTTRRRTRPRHTRRPLDVQLDHCSFAAGDTLLTGTPGTRRGRLVGSLTAWLAHAMPASPRRVAGGCRSPGPLGPDIDQRKPCLVSSEVKDCIRACRDR